MRDENTGPRRSARMWFMKRSPDREVDDEIAHHLERRTAEYVASGMDPATARAEALRRFGDVPSVRGETVRIDRSIDRRQRLSDAIRTIGRDAKIAMRSIRKSPAFALTVAVCIALGVCVTTTILSAADAVLLKPLPYPNADQLVAVYAENVPRGYHDTNISYRDYASWRDENKSLAALGIWTWVTKTMTDGESERVSGASVSANLFPLLGVHPLLGRDFLPSEERLASSDVVLLSYGLWKRRFGGDAAIVGHMISMDGRPHLVAGIMPPGFNFPDRGEFWMPFAADGPASESRADRGYAGAIGRLRPGVTLDQAKADLGRVATRLEREYPQENTGWSIDVKTLRSDLTGDLRRPVLVFLAAVALVLVIACANVGSLMLMRGVSRRREIAVRTALGAARGDLIRQLLTESCVLAVGAGIVGALVGGWATRLAPYAFPNGVPFYLRFGIDGRALAASAVVIALTAILCGLLPAVRSTRVNVNEALRDGDRGGTGGARDGHARGRALIVVGELALSTILMVGASLLVRSYRAYTHTDLGFDRAGILTARITLPEKRYDDLARRVTLFEDLERRVRAIPGASIVGSAQGIPFSGWDVQGALAFAGRPAARPNEEFVSHFQSLFPDFFPAMGIPVVRGRPLRTSDRDTLAPVAVINETFARTGLPGADPIGKRVKFGRVDDPQPWFTIVGVVRDFRHYRLPQPMGPALYTTYAISQSRSQTLVIRTSVDDPYTLVPSLRAALHDVDPQLAMYDVKTMGDAVDQALWRQRVQGQVLGVFAVLALVLATVGTYSLISYIVAQRTREIGVRVALGAQRSSVLALVYSHGLRLAAAGLAIGLVAAALISRAIASLLYQTSPLDPLTYAGVAAVVLGTMIAAVYIPARRAMAVGPMTALRME
jgi:putative ABC transport system permease protein